MKVQDFTQQDLRYDFYRISQDSELSHDLKSRLVELGLLDSQLQETEDGFGTQAMAALKRFQADNDCNEPAFLGPETTAKLLEAASIGSRAAAKPLVIKTLKETALKSRPIGVEMSKVSLPAGKELDVVFYETTLKHLRLTLTEPVEDKVLWYIPEEDVTVIAADPTGGDVLHPKQTPETVKLDVPYKSQRDNVNDPDITCNLTCLAMCMQFLKPSIKATKGGQLEDELIQYAFKNSINRESPYGMAKIAHQYGFNDRFETHAKVKAVKTWLAEGNPAITHGYFTRSGHIITLVGYNEKGFIVHDPFGEWYASGYDRNVPGGDNEKGKFKLYSYNLIERTCIDPDGTFWIHFVSA